MLEEDKAMSVITPYLVVPSVDEAARYYLLAWGARQSERYEDNTGKVWYSVLKIQGAPLQLMEPDAAMGLTAKDPSNGVGDSIAVNVAVTDVEFTYNRALAAGAEVLTELQEADWGGQTAQLRDPFGHRWVLGPRLSSWDRRKTPIAAQVVVEDVATSANFWQSVFGAKGARSVVGARQADVPFHVVRIRGAALQLTAPDPDQGLTPAPAGGHPSGDSSMVTVIVEDLDTTFDRALQNGATPIVEPQDAFWGDRYAEFRDAAAVRVSCCQATSAAEAVTDPATLQAKLDDYLAIHGDPTSPADAVNVQNVNVG